MYSFPDKSIKKRNKKEQPNKKMFKQLLNLSSLTWSSLPYSSTYLPAHDGVRVECNVSNAGLKLNTSNIIFLNIITTTHTFYCNQMILISSHLNERNIINAVVNCHT